MMNDILFSLYKYGQNRASFQWLFFKYIYVFDGGELYSTLLRRILKEYYNVDVGMYTHGGCFTPGNMDPFTTIGRYCSIARRARVINRNHPMENISTSAIFFNPALKIVENDSVEDIPITIGHDVWLGHNSIIMPNVKEIGTGAVIAAGAVVNKDVPPYAVVVGNPARVVRYRFEKNIIDALLESKWWEKSIEELKPHIREFQQFHGNLELLLQERPE
jgi:acetyltransferase-like isoleucine patch superfamily enzyme